MNVHELATSWEVFQRDFGVGGPIRDEAQYEQILTVTGELMEELSVNEDSPIASLVALMADRIREYEARLHPWPETATPSQVLAFLMEQHGYKQSDLAVIGSQGVVSEILRGKRELNVRQIGELSSLFKVSPAVFFPQPNNERFALAV